MPRNIERDKREADRRKNQLIEAGFRLFSQNGIETVSLQKVADAANVSPATMYKYFLTKEKLLIAISAKVWDEVWQEALGDPGTNHFEHFTAYQGIEFYADRMIALYKNRPEVLRFSGEYKTYMNRRGIWRISNSGNIWMYSNPCSSCFMECMSGQKLMAASARISRKRKCLSHHLSRC